MVECINDGPIEILSILLRRHSLSVVSSYWQNIKIQYQWGIKTYLVIFNKRFLKVHFRIITKNVSIQLI